MKIEIDSAKLGAFEVRQLANYLANRARICGVANDTEAAAELTRIVALHRSANSK